MSKLVLRNTESKLPKGWSLTTLENISLKLQAGGTPSTNIPQYYNNGTIPFVKIDDITDNEKYLENTKVSITNEGLENCSAWLIPKNSINYSMYASYGIPIINRIPVATSQAIIAFVPPHEFINVEYIYYYLQAIKSKLKPKGTTQRNLNAEIIRGLKIKLPPLIEQKRIVTKIDELFSKIEQSIENLETIQIQSNHYLHSFLKDAFSGKITKQWRDFHKDNSSSIENLLNSIRKENKNKVRLKSIPEKPTNFSIPTEWKFVLSNDLLIFVTSGSRDWAKYYDKNGALFLRVTNLDHNSIKLDLSKTKRVNPPKNSEGKRTLVSKNDILISITADVGMVGIIPPNFEEAYVNQHISLVRPHPRLNPVFLAWFLESPKGGQLQFQKLQRGMVKSGLGLNDIQSIWVPFPSLQEQEIIVNEIERQFSNLQQNKTLIYTMMHQLKELQKSILKQAFEGKLVSQDPNDEPAEILLKKIKIEKEKLEQKQKIIKSKSQKKRRKNVK